MSLDMFGHIDDVFESHIGTRTARTGGGYVDGVWVPGTESITEHRVNMQPLNMKEINFLQSGGERIQDTRKVYFNDGRDASISESDIWTFVDIDGNPVNGQFKCYALDNRSYRSSCKFYAVRLDV